MVIDENLTAKMEKIQNCHCATVPETETFDFQSERPRPRRYELMRLEWWRPRLHP